ncbi:pilus assembly protein TadG-related protein [Streptomonospora sp. S1-112]|uniref:Pilus assembly protein TadG-related protein n=1 Tax=Streptomonospora mangrovi TaxID=2883123 RepID=A0A9X3NKI6_9ACTN|nr:pilus assembly protein TadG-related protein [Streptomonospora mangrovi]MDA0565172.1 pilus assembly protein TadG-related protein [Streptomonospora mangrovi]
MGGRADRGQATAFTVTLAAVLVLLFALVWEGGRAMAARSRALTLAQEAARAGAQHLDLAAYRAGEETALDAPAARQAATAFLREAGAGGTARIEGDQVTVTARIDHTFALLPLGTRSLSASATASPHTGG